MKSFIKFWNEVSLVTKIFIGLIIGTGLGFWFPNFTVISVLGDIFVGALKSIAPILVFTLVLSSLAQNSKKIGKMFFTVIFLYMLNTFLSATVAIIASFVFPVSLDFEAVSSISNAPSGISEVLQDLLVNIVANPVDAISKANYMGILFWAVIFGFFLKSIASENTKQTLKDISDASLKVVCWIINFAPFGILGLVFRSISSKGLNIFLDYGKLILILVGCMLVMAFLIIPLIVALCLKKNPYPLVICCIKESGLTAFFTRSSAANIPVNMILCEKLKLDKDMYSVSIPLGATINTSGAAITISVMTLAAVHTLGISVDFPTALILSLIASLAACGASGVAGGSLLLIPMACSLFGIDNDISMQVVGAGFIIGIVQDSFETALNSSSDVIFTATAEYMQKNKFVANDK